LGFTILRTPPLVGTHPLTTPLDDQRVLLAAQAPPPSAKNAAAVDMTFA
jgi:hypothetical protein